MFPDLSRLDAEALRRLATDQQAAIERLSADRSDADCLAEEYRALFQLAGVGVAAAEAGTGRFLRVNRKFCELTGYSAEELLGRCFADITHPDDRKVNWEQLQALLAGDIPEMVAEKRYLRRDGSSFWAVLNATIVRNPDGTPGRSIAVIQDISDRKRSQEELECERERLRLVTENIDVVFWMSTPGIGKMLYVSSGYERIWGRSCESLYSEPRSFIDAVHPDDRERLIEGLKAHARGEWNFEYRIVRPDGEVRWIEDHGFAAYGANGELCCLTGIAADRTAQKRAECQAEEAQEALRRRSRDLERANAELERFAAVASHDLKAPLRAVGNLAALIEADLGEVPSAVRDHIELMQTRIRTMNRLVDDLLEYARAGEDAGTAEPVDLGQLVRHEAVTLALAPGFHLHVADNLPLLQTVSTPLTQVIHNLVGNAVVHHDRQEGNIWVSCTEQGSYCAIAVADDGPGVPVAERERIFDMFHTLHRAEGGTGIGLALVKKLVESVGGTVSLADRPGGGSVFTFTWPKNSRTPAS